VMRKYLYHILGAFFLIVSIGNIGFYAGRSSQVALSLTEEVMVLSIFVDEEDERSHTSFVCYAAPQEESDGQP